MTETRRAGSLPADRVERAKHLAHRMRVELAEVGRAEARPQAVADKRAALLAELDAERSRAQDTVNAAYRRLASVVGSPQQAAELLGVPVSKLRSKPGT